ncbi:uncharacterized protein LOC132177930 [Corylus avellana]|uniref:uncharacterized protein LOC132177930 n=1 Tax=Corylus avellana TaxID=13451 RepID=UPI00286B3029|nr:uncharacterized protein LOC132177930 [Corylus avellana]
MKLLDWNFRGLAHNPTIRVLRALIRHHRPDLLFLSETMVPSSRFQASSFGLGFSSWLEVPPVGVRGGIFLTWKAGVDVEHVRLDKRCISCLLFSAPSVCPWLVSCIYAPASFSGCHDFWPFLSDLGNSFGGPWLLKGDFNSVLSPAEKSGGCNFGSSSQGEFVDFVQYNALVDLGFFGNKFTWSNHRSGKANIQERLDRGLANQQWVHLFPNAVINHLPASQSDHCPILLSTEGSYQNIPKPFRFEAFWTHDKSSFSVVVEAWMAEVEGSPAFSLSRKENIGAYLVDHFSNIFSTSHPPLIDTLPDLVNVVISAEENVSICTIPDEHEIFVAIKELGLNKAPGPDGMTGLFYKTYWPIVKDSVVVSVQSFFRGGFLLKEFNHTNIALIPKVDNPSLKKGIGSLMALKLDMEKAFDSMEWDFLLRILTLLGFHPVWVQWIRQCITTSSFSILLDGAPYGKFTPSRGLRQDDVMIFSRANVSEARAILNCLSTYSKWSGQCINVSKSAVFFSRNCRPAKNNSIKGILNLNLIPARAKYLGIPLFMHKRKSDSFIELKDRIFSKITGWKARLLSQAARTTLVKLGWKLTSNQPLLWVDALRGKYLKNGVSFLDAPPNPSSSWLWKDLLKNRLVAQKGAYLILEEDRSWNASLLADLFEPSTVQNILRTFSVKSAHDISVVHGGRISPLAEDAWFSLWGLKLQARLKHLLWKIAWDILPSRANISRFVVQEVEEAWISSSLEHHLSAWRDSTSPSIWVPPSFGWLKGNFDFDVAVRSSFSVAAGVISDASGNMIMVVTHKLSSTDALAGEAFAALLTSRLAVSLTSDKFCIEGDALLVVLAINNPSLFSSWSIANCISDIIVTLSSFPSWNASKVSRCANFRAHALAKWAASNLVFGSMPIGSPILSSIRIRGGKDPPL